MNKEAIKLLKILKKPESIRYAPIVYLDNKENLPLILDLDLAKNIFTHKSIQPFDLWNYYKNLTLEHQLDHLETYFKSGPLLTHEQFHREIRLEVLILYKKLEPILEAWLTEHIDELKQNLDRDINSQLLSVENWVLKLLCHLLEKSLNLSNIPQEYIPDDFFYLLPNKQRVIAANQQLGNLISHIKKHNFSLSMRDILPSLTIIIMARQALIFNIFQRLYSTDQANFETSTPVNIIARTVINDFSINEFSFIKNQTIYLSPFLLRFFHPKSDLAFGWGPHQCPGKNLSLIIESHISHVTRAFENNPKLNYKITRDLSSTINQYS